MKVLQIDDTLLNVIVKSTRDGLAMAGLKPVPVGASKRFSCTREVTAIIGCAGQATGSILINASEEGACFLASKMLGEELKELDSAVLDGVCEICNIIAGQSKAILSTTEYKFDRISTPSVVVGSNYFISHYRGAISISVDFELPDIRILPRQDMTFSIALFLMKV